MAEGDPFADVVNIPASWFQGTHTLAPLRAIYAVHRPCARQGCPHYRRVLKTGGLSTAGYCCSRCYFNKGHGENCTGRPEGCIFVDQPSLGSAHPHRTKRDEKECNNERPRDSARRRKSRSPADRAKRAARGNGKKRMCARSALHFFSSRSSSTSSQNMVSGNERGRSHLSEDTRKRIDLVKGMGAAVVAATTAAAADSTKGTPRRRETSVDATRAICGP